MLIPLTKEENQANIKLIPLTKEDLITHTHTHSGGARILVEGGQFYYFFFL
jgi:hypothetical protein